MAAHTKEQREFIVRRLAAFETPDGIAAAFAARFTDTTCTVEDVTRTDPRVAIVDPDLHTMFLAERERVLTDPTLAPYAAQQARLIALSRDVEAYRSRGDLGSARAVLRQIAEELGVVGGKAGKADAPNGQTPEFKSVTVVHEIVDPKVPE